MIVTSLLSVVIALIELLSASGMAARSSHRVSVQTSDAQIAVKHARLLVDEILAASYPELQSADIRIKTFDNKGDYFRVGFSSARFLFGKRMSYVVLVNPKVFDLEAPAEAVRAILAHELGHVLYFRQRKRVELLGLVRLASKRFTARFERWADLQAISRGYGKGLKEYRAWLYGHIPPERLAEKKRNYFSPEEIDGIMIGIQKKPERLAYWLKNVPLNLSEIQTFISN